MKGILKYLFIASLCFAATYVNAQTGNRSEVRIFYGDTYPLAFSSFAGDLFPNALLDEAVGINKKTDYTGMFGAGYRYLSGRFGLGADLGLIVKTTNWTLPNESSSAVRDREYWVVVMPTGEYTYFKKGIFELYSSVGVGTMLAFDKMKELNTDGIGDNRTGNTLKFAYQVDPIAIRLQGKKMGYFIEGGVGYKGFVSTGLSYRF